MGNQKDHRHVKGSEKGSDPSTRKRNLDGGQLAFFSLFFPSLKLLKTYPLMAEINASWFSVHITKSGSRKSGIGVMHLRCNQSSTSASVSHPNVEPYSHLILQYLPRRKLPALDQPWTSPEPASLSPFIKTANVYPYVTACAAYGQGGVL